MRIRGISVEIKTFDSLVKCFCNKGDLHKATHIIDEMVLDRCVIGPLTWSALVGGVLDRRKVREASELLLIELLCRKHHAFFI